MISLNEGGEAPVSHVNELGYAIFTDGGMLCSALQLEHRAEQERMARAVAAAMSGDTNLLVEAGTGVGKSLAYLLPGIIHAVDTGRQMVVSTHTKTLQEQIRDKDLPKCRSLFQAVPDLAAYRNFTSAVLMGKGNYLCTTRLARALQDKRELFPTPQQAELERLLEWSKTTSTGLLVDFQPQLHADIWDEVSADSDACSAKNCTDGKCFYRRAKALCDSANLLIVNHSLLFTLLSLQGSMGNPPASGVLRLSDFAVFDEAHTVPDIATEHLGLSLSSTGLSRLLHSLYNPTRTKGLFVRYEDTEAARIVEIALEKGAGFFAGLAERLPPREGTLRVREAGIAQDDLAGPLNGVLARLELLRSRLPEGVAQDEVKGRLRRISAYRDGIHNWLTQAEPKHVHWIEGTTRKASLNVHLRSAPLDVAADLRRQLFTRKTSVVLTSATLATGPEMGPFRERTGAHGADMLVERSPFDFERNMRVFVAADMPEPAAEGRLDLETLTDYVRFCTLQVNGGSLVLFTSYRDLSTLAATLAPVYAAAGRQFLRQQAGASRSLLAEQLRQAGNGVLFGTESFWTGIDIPGPALSQVIITRLPFEPPNHPVKQARAEWIESEGGNPFGEIMLPEALGRFRQGIGRLIRSRTDRGVITLLDPRILTKPYGRDFIACLPNRNIRRITRVDRATLFRPFP